MKKFFTSKKLESKGKWKYSKTDLPSSKEPNKLYFDSDDSYILLESWCDYANLKINELPDILASTHIIHLPIYVYGYKQSNSKVLCKDSNEIYFYLDFNYTTSRLFFNFEFENESFDYILNYKNGSNDFDYLTLVSHIKNSESGKYNFAYDKKVHKIKQTLHLENHLFIVEISFLSDNQTDILDKILKNPNLHNTFDNLETFSSNSLLETLIKNLELTEDDLISLEINVTFLINEIIVSKIKLSKNKISQLIFGTEDGYYDLSSDGKLIFNSADCNLTITVNNILSMLDNSSKNFKDFNKIIDYANKMLNKMEDNTI
mgnify:CR=1 FL=1